MNQDASLSPKNQYKVPSLTFTCQRCDYQADIVLTSTGEIRQ